MEATEGAGADADDEDDEAAGGVAAGGVAAGGVAGAKTRGNDGFGAGATAGVAGASQ